jgi:hypothetical protein
MQTLLNPLAGIFDGPAIVTRYLAGSSRIVATHKRGQGETERLSLAHSPALSSEGNHRAAAEALAERMGHGPRVLVARGHDADCYVWVSVGAWQLESAAHALAACRELVAACAAGADAEALALPLMLARIATGQRGGHPAVVAGFALPQRDGVEVRDILGQALFTLPDTYSAAHALACAEAAGWLLTAEMRAVAARHRDICGDRARCPGGGLMHASTGSNPAIG